jgi:ribosome biogenesis GTPase
MAARGFALGTTAPRPTVTLKTPRSAGIRSFASDKDDSCSGPTSNSASVDSIIGRVMAAQANFVRVKVEQTGDGELLVNPPKDRLLCVVRALLKKMKRQVFVGDMVKVVGIDWVDGRGMVEDVLSRATKLDEPPVANISRIMLVFSLSMPPFLPSAATRYLVAAEHAGLPVTVVLNKCDLVTQDEMMEEVHRIEKWGYDCLNVSVKDDIGLEILEERLKGDVTVVAGPSGAGKSSIINALSLRAVSNTRSRGNNENVDLQAVGDVSERIGRGKHTTRNVTIIELAGGGSMVDTPGFNQPSLSFPSSDLENCFPEIRSRLSRINQETNLPQRCSFKNCRHLLEPGCVVQGEWDRYDMYVDLYNELQATEELLAKRAMAKRRREGNIRRKRSAGGVVREEARLDTKSHRRTSRRSVKQEISVLSPEDTEDYNGSFEIK